MSLLLSSSSHYYYELIFPRIISQVIFPYLNRVCEGGRIENYTLSLLSLSFISG